LFPLVLALLKHALIECDPAARADVARLACLVVEPLPVNVVVDPRGVPPLHPLLAFSTKATLLPGGNVQALLQVIVAVNVMD
jgi:hypothetical protein